MRDLPGPGLEPVSPALAGRFSTTAPLGRSQNCQFWYSLGELLSACGAWTSSLVNSVVNWRAVMFTRWHTMCSEVCFIFVYWTLNSSQCWRTSLSSFVFISFRYPCFCCLDMIPKWDWVMFFLCFLMFWTVPCFGGWEGLLSCSLELFPSP